MLPYTFCSCITGPDGKMHHLVLVAYKFNKVTQEAVLVNLNGNFKSNKNQRVPMSWQLKAVDNRK